MPGIRTATGRCPESGSSCLLIALIGTGKQSSVPSGRGRRPGSSCCFRPGPDGQPVRLVLEDLGIDRAIGNRPGRWVDTALTARRKTTTRDYWCRPARRWLSVTPIALDRFPGNLRSREPRARERAEAEAAASVARACVFAGLAELPGQVRVTIRLDLPWSAFPPARQADEPGARQFPGYQTGTGTPRACVHAEIEFDEPVEGPVLVGAGRYLGYGLCLARPATGMRPS